MSIIRKKTIDGLKKGDSFTVSRTFTEQDMEAFADSTRDYNPVHFDERFARAKKFKGRICHGLMPAGMLTEIGGQIGWLATRMDFRFKKPVYFGDAVQCTFTITDIDDRGWAKADAVYTNQEGVAVIEAFLEGVLPSAAERRILSDMVAEGDPTNKV